MPEIKEIWWVAIFLIDQAWGGSEEGGWWYQVGEYKENNRWNRMFDNEQEARQYAERLDQRLIPVMNKGRRPIDSVLSEGVYAVEVWDEQPHSYPTHRPHYE